jgi:hypothetical protein
MRRGKDEERAATRVETNKKKRRKKRKKKRSSHCGASRIKKKNSWIEMEEGVEMMVVGIKSVCRVSSSYKYVVVVCYPHVNNVQALGKQV